MPKPRKDGKYINCRIEREIYEKLEDYCAETGLSKTVAVEKALQKQYADFEKKRELYQ